MEKRSPRQLRRVTHREIRTFYEISEMLECGHRYESLSLLSDPLIAKHRDCQACAALPLKKPVSREESTSSLPAGLARRS
jgi:hypothetical protein